MDFILESFRTSPSLIFGSAIGIPIRLVVALND